MGDLHRKTPFSPTWGVERGRPLDRHYIEAFLQSHQEDICGRVLEVKDAGYTKMFGAAKVTQSDVVDVDRANTSATIYADLTSAPEIPSETYDCFICTQTLGLIYDVRAAVSEAARILKPGGILLCTLPASGRLSPEGLGIDGDLWRFGEAAVRKLFAESFAPHDFEIEGFGSVETAAAFLYGMNPDDLDPSALEHRDPYFPVVYGVRAVKPRRAAGRSVPTNVAGVVLMYHRVTSSGTNEYRTDRDLLERHLDALIDLGCVVVPLADALTPSAGDRRVALTFDDGYADALDLVAPILVSRGLPATFFVIANDEDGSSALWWETLRHVFMGREALPAQFDVDSIPVARGLPTGNALERREVCARLMAELRRLDRASRDVALNDVLAWARVGEFLAASALGPTAVRDLSRLKGHDDRQSYRQSSLLPSQPEEVQRQELVVAKARLEELIAFPVDQLAYPYGGWNATTVQLAAEAGYRHAVTADDRAFGSKDSPLAIPRMDAGYCSVEELSARLRAVGF